MKDHGRKLVADRKLVHCEFYFWCAKLEKPIIHPSEDREKEIQTKKIFIL